MTVMQQDVLAELEQRAGASDKDRERWLSQRRVGVTATEIRDLYLGAKRADDLIAEKLGRRENSFGGNAYTRWGNEREPVIAAVVEARYAIAPESRLIRAADDPRKLASPDGLGVDFDGMLVASEIKTAGVDISSDRPAFEKKGYLYQAQWVMRVTGARRLLYAWEERFESAPGVFEPGEQHFEWIEYDETLAGKLEVIADEFLAMYDLAASAPWEEAEVDEDLDTLAVNLLTFRVKEAEGKKAKDEVWAQLHERLAERGGDFRQESILARITYTAAAADSTLDVLDVDAAIAADPEMHAVLVEMQEAWAEHVAKFKKTITLSGKAGLTVTAVKQKGSKK